MLARPLSTTSDDRRPGAFARTRLELQTLWVYGLAALVLVLGRLLPIGGHRLEWAEYLLLGSVFPASLAGFLALRPRTARLAPLVPAGLLLLGLAGSGFLIVRLADPWALVLALLQLAVAIVIRARRDHADLASQKSTWLFLGALVALLSWSAALPLLWWTILRSWTLSSAFGLMVFALALALCAFALWPVRPSGWLPVSVTGRIRWPEGRTATAVGTVVALTVIGYVSLRTDGLLGADAFHHWGFIVGPVDLVRQGGWLLWDVPAQYGFLSILTVAIVPLKSAWSSLYVANAVANFGAATVIFLVLRAAGRGILHDVFALVVTLAAVFFRSGLLPGFAGPQVYPSTGGLRFFWCDALLGILLLMVMRRSDDRKRLWLLVLGTLVWLTGSLWSAESAIYCSVIWLPAYALIVWQRSKDGDRRRRLRRALGWLAVPAILMLCAVGLITVVYVLGLGHAPDWYSFVEYGLSYGLSDLPFYVLPLDFGGPVWVSLILFCGLVSLAVYLYTLGNQHEYAVLMTAGSAAVWVTTSYFVSRSHPNNLVNLLPTYCLGIGLALYVLRRIPTQPLLSQVIKTSMFPVLVIAVVLGFANQQGLSSLVSASGLPGLATEQRLPTAGSSLQALLDEAMVSDGEAIVYDDPSTAATVMPAWRTSAPGARRVVTEEPAWLPALPVGSLNPLTPERRRVYLERFIGAFHRSGWLVQSLRTDPSADWLVSLLGSYKPTRVYENADWKLTWYQIQS